MRNPFDTAKEQALKQAIQSINVPEMDATQAAARILADG